MTNKEFGFGAIAVGAVTIAAFAINKARKASKKVDDICNRLEMCFDDIQNRSSIEISDGLIDSVVRNAAERQLDRVIPGEVKKAVDSVRDDAWKNVRTDISRKVDALAPSIESKLDSEMGRVSIDEMRKAVVEKAAEKATKECIEDIRQVKATQISEIKEYAKNKKNDIDEAVDDIIEDLQDKADDRFDEELDDLTTKYKSRLDDVSNIYSSLANKIMK